MSRTQVDERGGETRSGVRAAHAIRPTRQADLPALSEFFAGLSARTRYLRFFAPVTPGAAMLALLSGDSGQADAVVAVRDGAIIGHAMAVDRAGPRGPGGPGGGAGPRSPGGPGGPGGGAGPRSPGGSRPTVTDIGVVVADAWQGHGVGSALTRALVARAWARGVTWATMDVLPGNQQVLAMIVGRWPAARVTRSPDCTTISCPLAPLARAAHVVPALAACLPSWPFGLEFRLAANWFAGTGSRAREPPRWRCRCAR